MKIVVTGVLGHIGSRLIRELPDRLGPLELLLIDNLSSQRYTSLFNLPRTAVYDFREADVRDADLVSLFDGAEAVIHLAAIANAPASFDNPRQVADHNFTCTQRVAEACLATGAALIFPSTTSVYGPHTDTVDENCPESDLNPQSPYAETKLREERLISELTHTHGLRATIARFGTIFGVSPGMRFHTAVNKFCWQAATGQPLTVWRTALDQQRPYLDLGDAVRAVAFMLEKRLFDGRCYNVLTANATVREIVDIVRDFVPGAVVEFADHEILNQQSYTVLNERIRAEGFVFQGDLRTGIRATIDLLGPLAPPPG